MEDSRIALPIGTTLDRFIKKKQDEFQYATGELSQLLRDIALAGKVVNREINKAGLMNIVGGIGTQNVQGEDQQKLDVLANIRFIRALTKGGEACAIVSEEDEDITDLKNDGKYVIAIDPLDGSSNIDVNVSIGTIFSVYRRVTPVGMPIKKEDALQKGIEQVAAGYLLYGSSTMLVYTTHPDMIIPEEGKIYSINEGSYNSFSEEVKDYLNFCRDNNYSARYIGSLVADFHRNLLKGGIYIYPATAKDPKGKIRLLYECNALAFIIEQAGGSASTGTKRVLEIQPDEFHQRVPIFIGSKKMVEKAESFY